MWAPPGCAVYDIQGLVEVVLRTDMIIELLLQVGDFLGTGDPLFHVLTSGGSVDAREPRGAIALDPERTIEQDPAFGFRSIIVDIASKALSRDPCPDHGRTGARS
jgi:uncharacterized membrane protein